MENLHTQMQALMSAVEQLNATVASQQAQLTNLTQTVQASQPHQPVPQPAPVQVVKEPKMPTPEKFSGSRSDFRNFRSRCLSYFEVRPISSGSEAQRIAFIKTLLQGDSQTWAYELPPSHSALTSVEKFFEAMAVIYDDPDIVATAARKLRSLRQGHMTAEEYAAEFRKWSSTSKWDHYALLDQFVLGLSDRIADVFIAHPEPRSLDDAMTLAIKIDRRIRYHYHSRGQTGTPSPTPAASFQPSPSPRDEPMEIGLTKLSKSEKLRRRQEGLCLYCAGQGHMVSKCPKKPGNFSA